eukprot:IDg9834t1
MEKVIRCCIILRNIMAEDHGDLSDKDISEEDTGLVKIRGSFIQMWGGLQRIPGTVLPLPASIAALCESHAFLYHSLEYFIA